ncbi:MAG: hypothetical protein ACREO3_09325 [Arenimonas sp.]
MKPLPACSLSLQARVSGCRGKFLQVDIGNGVAGWTDTWCNNERTTCS